MCPVVLLALLLSLLLLILEITAALTVSFSPATVEKLNEDAESYVRFNVSDADLDLNDRPFVYYDLRVDDTIVADIIGNKSFYVTRDNLNGDGIFNNSFTIKGKFLGHTNLRVELRNDNKIKSEELRHNSTKNAENDNKLPISVVRKVSQISKIFVISVAVLVSINYINMGCALDMSVVIGVLKKPIAPVIGFVCQYAFMPVIAYFVGKWLLNESFLRLGLFTFGCSPGGGASNMWTVLLSGNLNLSITMTFISTLFAIAMMPLWLFTLGREIYKDTTTSVPLHSIFGSLCSMIIFLGLGLIIKKYLPKVAAVCRRILAPVSIAMIIFIIVFGTYANFYMFKMMSWRIILSAAINVWSGFLIGFAAAVLFKQPLADQISVSIETGIQNTGVSIVLLGLSLPQPDADIASVVPVAASVMTPIPLTIALIIIKIRNRYSRSKKLKVCDGILEDDEHSTERMYSNKTSSDTLTNGNTPEDPNGFIAGAEKRKSYGINNGHVISI